MPKFTSVSKVLTKLLQKQNGAMFWDTVYSNSLTVIL